jgi:GNAT superfamily N-acetyltransferase
VKCATTNHSIHCWELLSDTDDLLFSVRQLYESALDVAERVPWEWLERGVKTRRDWKPGTTNKHLMVATTTTGELAGFAFALYLPGYGGYISYVAVQPEYRGQGIANKLFHFAYQVLRIDAMACNETLPFVIWESHNPGVGHEKLWLARMRLFEHVGGFVIDGVTLSSPNWMDDTQPPVPLQLFLAPQDEAWNQFDSARVRQAVDGLLRRVYRAEPGEPEYDETLTAGCHPRLRRPTDRLTDGGLVRAG